MLKKSKTTRSKRKVTKRKNPESKLKEKVLAFLAKEKKQYMKFDQRDPEAVSFINSVIKDLESVKNWDTEDDDWDFELGNLLTLYSIKCDIMTKVTDLIQRD